MQVQKKTFAYRVPIGDYNYLQCKLKYCVDQKFCLNQKSCLNQKTTVQLCDGKKEDVQGLRMTPNQLTSAPPLLDKNLSVSCITLFEDSNCTIESVRIIDGVI